MRFTALVLLAAAALPARSEPQSAPAALSADEIVRRAVAVMERHPDNMVCKIVSDRMILDGDGGVNDEEKSEIEETRHGADVEWRTLRKWKNGRDVTGQALAEQRRKDEEKKKNGGGKKKDDDLMEPFSAKWSSHYSFQLVRQEKLWGRPTYVLRVTSHENKEHAGNGLAWIDAQDFVELKGEFVPAKMPDNADWARFQVQYTLFEGFAVPTLLKFEGAGHKWFIKRGFRQVFKWQGCR